MPEKDTAVKELDELQDDADSHTAETDDLLSVSDDETTEEEAESDSTPEGAEKTPQEARTENLIPQLKENLIPQSRFKKAVDNEVNKRLQALGIDPTKKQVELSKLQKRPDKSFSDAEVLNFRLDAGLKSTEEANIVADYAAYKGMTLAEAFKAPSVRVEINALRKKRVLDDASLGVAGRGSSRPKGHGGAPPRRAQPMKDWYAKPE